MDADPQALGRLPVLIASSYGTIRTNTSTEQFPEFHLGTSEDGGRSWNGFRNAATQGRDVLAVIEALRGKTSQPGIVVSSEAGTVMFNLKKAQ